ncbi:MAG: diguanylate cyclase, partial [Lachnospiraceae bacterium]|nr:diguanylate cyclase [Lachnospiraceae bacterium]
AEHGVVARMGGDEFIAVVNTADNAGIAALMEQFQENINKKNREIGDLEISLACGRASGTENGDDIEKVYQLADNRMYEHKKQMKQGRR